MTGVIKRMSDEGIDTEEECHMETGAILVKSRATNQKLEERPGTCSSLTPSREHGPANTLT